MSRVARIGIVVAVTLIAVAFAPGRADAYCPMPVTPEGWNEYQQCQQIETQLQQQQYQQQLKDAFQQQQEQQQQAQLDQLRRQQQFQIDTVHPTPKPKRSALEQARIWVVSHPLQSLLLAAVAIGLVNYVRDNYERKQRPQVTN